MRTIRLIKKDTGQPIWVNIDRISMIEAAADGGTLIFVGGLSRWVEEFPSEVFDLLQGGEKR